ncbi:MAG: DedA family protein [Gammaproteobacteria bacterium]|nr:DedA family protein [Gammaproteobacteria bacterium]MDH5803350.1 DedA family protein [Gammaproteobacteria bacterium]
MKLFSPLYERAMRWAAHRHAQWYLAVLSFAESSFFPIPPDVMLAPMALANTRRAWYFASLTTVTSVLGGVLGYLIGAFAFDVIEPVIITWGYMEKYQLAVNWFTDYGVWVIFIAGFSPIPYKVFTIASGVVAMAFVPFLLASILGRGARFFLVAGLMVWGGSKMQEVLNRHVDRIGWATVVLAVLGFVIMELR